MFAQPITFIEETDKTSLTRKEKDLLAYLKENEGKCLPRQLLLREVWGYQDGVRSRTLDVHVQRLRKKLRPEEGSRILTVFKSGYVWTPAPECSVSVNGRQPSVC